MMVNVPSAAAFFWLTIFVSWLTTVTLASGTTAPDVSTTVPFTTAVGVCANNAAEISNSAQNSDLMFNLLVESEDAETRGVIQLQSRQVYRCKTLASTKIPMFTDIATANVVLRQFRV